MPDSRSRRGVEIGTVRPGVGRWRPGAELALVAILMGGLLCTAALVPGSSASAAGGTCSAGQTLTAAPDTTLDRLFQSYGNAGQGATWTGGDGTQSVAVPGGEELWLFGDSVLGVVTDGLRNFRKSPYIHNSIVVQIGGKLTRTYYTHRTTRPTAYLNPRPARPYVYAFWPGAPVVDESTLQVVGSLQKFNKAGTPTQIGEEFATFRLPDLKRLSLRPMAPSPVNWPDGEPLTTGGFTYLYGSSTKGIEVARVPGTNLSSPWSYYDGSGWTNNAAEVVPIDRAVPVSSFSVSEIGTAYVLIAKTSLSSNEIMGALGCSPVGPFGPLQSVYATPEETQYPASDGVVTYGAHAHPELSAPADSVVVSYDVNPRGPQELKVPDASIYRPRFLYVTVG